MYVLYILFCFPLKKKKKVIYLKFLNKIYLQFAMLLVCLTGGVMFEYVIYFP